MTDYDKIASVNIMSAETFIAEKIEGKTRKEAIKEIKKLGKMIRRLNRAVDANWDPYECMASMLMEMHLGISEDRYHECIDAAKKYFEAQGWVFEPTAEEMQDQKFNDRLGLIKSIDIIFSGYSCQGEGQRIIFNGEEVMIQMISVYPPLSEEEQKPKLLEGKTRSEILDGLRELHMGKWKNSYSHYPFLDGERWDIRIRYTNGKTKIYSGITDYPENFDDFLELMGMGRRHDLPDEWEKEILDN